MNDSRRHQIAIALLFITPALWSVNYLVARTAPGFIAPNALALLRWLTASALFALGTRSQLWAQRHQIARDWKQYVVLGALGMWICGAGVYIAGRTTSAVNIAIIYSASPVLILAFSAIWLKEKITVWQTFGVALGLAGVLHVVLKGQWTSLMTIRFVPGDGWIMAATLSWALYSLLLKQWASPMEPRARLAVISFAGTCVILPFAIWEAIDSPLPFLTTTGAELALAAAIFPGYGAYLAYSVMQRELGAARVSVVLYLAPIYAAALAWLVLAEPLQTYHALGIVLVLPGVFMVTRKAESIDKKKDLDRVPLAANLGSALSPRGPQNLDSRDSVTNYSTRETSGSRTPAWSDLALMHMLKSSILRKDLPTLKGAAAKSWEIAPAQTSVSRRAYYLPNQLDRVTGWAFAKEHPRSAMEGGVRLTHGATRGYLLRDVWLLDGTLYKDKSDAFEWLTSRSSVWKQFRVNREIDRGAVFCTPAGNKYFGNWLMDNCVSYPLACSEGIPVTTAQPISSHIVAYESWLGMKPERLESAFFHELVIFDDVGQNQNKHLRFRAMSNRLLSHVQTQSHPGVFILRGQTGELRLLRNELELAELLRDKHGFRIVDPRTADVPTIVATCAGARTVIGIEGSQLIHGIVTLQPGGSVVALQPPNRFVHVYKDLTDREHQHFGFVVGVPDHRDGSFWIDPVELERTLELLPAAEQPPLVV